MKHTIQKIPNVKNTARGIVISSWIKKYLYSPYIFLRNYNRPIIHKWPLPHPLRSTIDMLTRVSIPYDNMRWFFSRTDISKEEKCMFTRKSRNIFPFGSYPWNHPLIRRSITTILPWDGERSEYVVIDFVHDAIFIDICRTPVSPEYDMWAEREWVENIAETISGEHISFFDTIKYLCRDVFLLEHSYKWWLVDTIPRKSSLWSRVWTDKFFLWISPDSIITEVSRKYRKHTYDNIFGYIFLRHRLDHHTECSDLARKFIFLQREFITRRDIESGLSRTELESIIESHAVFEKDRSFSKYFLHKYAVISRSENPPERDYGSDIFLKHLPFFLWHDYSSRERKRKREKKDKDEEFFGIHTLEPTLELEHLIVYPSLCN